MKVLMSDQIHSVCFWLGNDITYPSQSENTVPCACFENF